MKMDTSKLSISICSSDNGNAKAMIRFPSRIQSNPPTDELTKNRLDEKETIYDIIKLSL